MGRACSANVDKRNAYGLLVGEPDGKRPVGRPRLRWMDNTRMGLPSTASYLMGTDGGSFPGSKTAGA
jgi:hypothetical protein